MAAPGQINLEGACMGARLSRPQSNGGMFGSSPLAGAASDLQQRHSRSAALLTPTTLKIRVETPVSDDSKALVSDSQTALLKHLPADEIFSLDAQALNVPNVTFLVARVGGEAVGCVALLDETYYGEVKRLYVRDHMRGRGVAFALMRAVETYCNDIGLLALKLETSPALADAVRLYESMGYTPCPAFGNYPVLDSSLFMEKTLASLS